MRVSAKFTLCQVTFLACFSVICYEKWPVLTKNKKDGLQREGESRDRNFNHLSLINWSIFYGIFYGGTWMQWLKHVIGKKTLASSTTHLRIKQLTRELKFRLIQLFPERLSEKQCSWHCSCWTYFCCLPSALANIRAWPLVPFFQISLKNSELKTTHNTFRDCRVHFFRQPFSK